MAQVQANGITIEYERHGSGEPLLFIMGLGGQLTDWPMDFIQEFVDRGFEVIRFDNRDSGLSTEFDWKAPSTARLGVAMVTGRKPEAGYTLVDCADDAAGLLDALGIESAHVLGISMGGMISQQLAISHPEKVRSLTSIMSKPGDPRSGGIAPKLMRQMLRRPRPTRANAIEEGVKLFRKISGPHFDPDYYRQRAEISVARSFRPAGTARLTTAIAASPDRTPGLRKLTIPVLVVHGMKDPLVLKSGGIATAKAVKHSTLVMFPDMGHDLPKPRWTEMADAVLATTKKAAAAPGADTEHTDGVQVLG